MINEIKEKTNKNYDPLEKSSLTKRETTILKLVAMGYNNVEIGEVVHISYHTVKIHVSSILKKINKKTRTQAAIFAMRNEIV